MLSYILLISVVGFFAFIQSSGFNDLKIVKYKKYLKPLSFVILTVFIGLRYKVGADWFQYLSYYNNVEGLGTIIFNAKNAPYFYDHNWEPAFKLLCAITKSLGISFQGLVLLITTFNLYSLNKFVSKYLSGDACIFLVLFLSLNMLREFDILRQSLAFYILLFAYEYINKNFLKYLLICFLASLFHISALIFVPAYLFFRWKVNRKVLIAIFFMFLGSLVFKFGVLSIIVNIFETILPGDTSAFFFHQIKLYLEFYPVHSNINFVTLLSLGLLAILILNYKKINTFDPKFIVLFVIFIIISILFAEVGEVQSRFGYFFSTGLVYCVARSLVFYKRYTKMIYVICIVLYSNIKVILPLRLEATLLTYTPYRNYIFYMDQNEATEKEILLRYNKAQELSRDFFNDNIEN